MTKLQFRVLFREFLFRMVDLELLSAQGDITRLLGQFAALLLFVSSALGLGGMLFGGRMPPELLTIVLWSMAHFLIATTMLVVGIFAVLSWDSAFPDRRDVLVLAPLPVRPRTLFLAKVAALATALGLTVGALNACSGIFWPMHFIQPGTGFLGLLRVLLAYWVTIFAAGAFVFCAVLGVQGIAAQLPRRRYLRVSAFLQLAAFCLFLCVYFLQPSLTNPRALMAPGNQRALAWLPSYWFFGLFQSLNGSAFPAMAPLARRAVAAVLIAVTASGCSFLLAYFRTLRKIVEEPDILPGARGGGWSPRFGTLFETAVVLFGIRTLFRSRQHRVILAFYLGVAFAIVTLYMQTSAVRERLVKETNVPMLVASALLLCFWIAGTRVVFSMPLDLRANWIFRVTPLRGGQACLSAARRSLFVLALIPFWIVVTAVFLWLWPWRPALVHLGVLGLLGLMLGDAALFGFRKIPFTCSYLPGKTQVHMVFLAGLGLILAAEAIAPLELRALGGSWASVEMLVGLGAGAAVVRWRTDASAGRSEAVLMFEEEMAPVILTLDLGR